jgi:hypothetical protein
MQQIAPRRRLRSFREVTKHIGLERQVGRLAEAMNLTESRRNGEANPKVDLNYFTVSIPMVLSEEEKNERLSDLVETVTAIDGSDVILVGIWVSPKA